MNQRKRALHEAEALKRKLAESAASAIAQKNIQFALDHQHDSLVKLKLYLRDCAAALGHTPVRTEIIGGDYIDLRFGSWKNALDGVGAWNSSMEYFPIALEKTKLYQAELAAQEEQYNAEQAAKKPRKRKHGVRPVHWKPPRTEVRNEKAKDPAARQRPALSGRPLAG